MGSIRLHPTLGVNPRMTYCEWCGKDIGIALIGANDNKYKHPCGSTFLGFPELNQKCPKCKEPARDGLQRDGKIAEHEKIPGGLCDECQKRCDCISKAINEGGIPWKCEACSSKGAFVASAELSKEIRAWAKLHPEKSVLDDNGVPVAGITFTKDECPICTPISEKVAPQ